MRILHLIAVFIILLSASKSLAEKPIEDILGLFVLNRFEEARSLVRTFYNDQPAMSAVCRHAQQAKDFFFMYESIGYRIQTIKQGTELSSTEKIALFSDMLFLYLLTLCNESHRLPAASVLMTIFEHWYKKYLAPAFALFPLEAAQRTFAAVSTFLEETFTTHSSNPFCTTILACTQQNYRIFDCPSCKTYDVYYVDATAISKPEKEDAL